MNPNRFCTRSLQDPRILRILAAAIDAVDPAALVRAHLHLVPTVRGRTFVIGIGKAAPAMVEAVMESLSVDGALVITKNPAPPRFPQLQVLGAGHPVPDERSVRAGLEALALAARLNQDDLLICLISGGGSALAVAPVPDVTLSDLRLITRQLLMSGASITEINSVRKRLDRIKDGGLASETQATVLGFILSDVPEGGPEQVASGPTAAGPDPSSAATMVIGKYAISVPPALERALRTPVPRRPASARKVRNILIGDNSTALRAAEGQARQEGFRVSVGDTGVSGEARSVGIRLAETLSQAGKEVGHPWCQIEGGEAIVTVVGPGHGGRNQEVALAAVPGISRIPGAMLVSLATDGEDGPTDAAGAVVTTDTMARAQRLGLQHSAYLANNNSYEYFDALGDLLRTGVTGTNVNDLFILIRE